jgi:hypothetical protein
MESAAYQFYMNTEASRACMIMVICSAADNPDPDEAGGDHCFEKT